MKYIKTLLYVLMLIPYLIVAIPLLMIVLLMDLLSRAQERIDSLKAY